MHMDARSRGLRRTRSLRFAFLSLAAAAAWLLAQGDPLFAAPRTWIAGATVLSPEQKDSGRKLNVLVDGERIAAVATELPAEAAQDATVVNADGLFLIPGLIDGHTHLQSVPGFTAVMQFDHAALVRAYRAQLPRSFLRYGYTTVIDLIVADPDALAAFAQAPARPDFYTCGPALPVPGGYPMQNVPALFRDRAFPNTVVEPKDAGGSSAHTPEAAVARVKQDGGICVKTFFQRGFGRDRNLPVPSAELFAGIVKAAHGAGLPVLLHANSIEAQRFGMDGGTDVFVHGLWNWGEFNDAQALPDAAKEVLNRVVAHRTGYMPTIQVIGGLRLLYEPEYFDQPAVRRVVPKALLDWYRTADGRWFKDEQAGGASDEQMRGGFDRVLWRAAETTRYLAQRDANFLFGTDTPSGPTPGNLPGLNGYLEMQRLVAAGVTLRQLFDAATLNNAKAFGLMEQVGTIEPGKRANLLLLKHSPLESVEAYDAIQTLWIAGRRLDPASLEAAE
jgi:imidazolonepropionase-like amidohydrolase